MGEGRHELAILVGVAVGEGLAVMRLAGDEVGMAGTRELAHILGRAQAAGTKVVLTGDRRQLASVSGASAMQTVVDVVDRHATLTEVRRQEVDGQRAASTLMARGDVEAGVRAYARHGRVELVSGAERRGIA